MARHENRQSGFSIVEAVVVVAAIAIVGAVGWFAYQHNRPTTSKAAGDAGQTTNNQPVTTPPAPTVTYLEIKEWGVKLPLSDTIKDAYYVVSTASSTSADGKPSGVWLGRAALGGSKCDPSNNDKGGLGALGTIFRFLPTDADAVTGQPLAKKYPDAIMIGNYYYVYRSWAADNPCASAAALQATDTAFANAAKGAVSTGAAN